LQARVDAEPNDSKQGRTSQFREQARMSQVGENVVD
jgi:hypothetical protein